MFLRRSRPLQLRPTHDCYTPENFIIWAVQLPDVHFQTEIGARFVRAQWAGEINHIRMFCPFTSGVDESANV